MTACRRFDEEAIPRLEAGLAETDRHFEDCPDCRAAREGHERLLAALRSPNRRSPPSAWRERVFAEIAAREARESPRPRRVRWWTGAAALVAASLVVWLGGIPRPPSPPAVVGLNQRVVAAATQSRGGGELARPGDRLELVGETGGAAFAELRLYLNRDRLVWRCAGDPPACRRRGGRLEAELTLGARGDYLPILVLSQQPIVPPGLGFEADIGAALAAGARVEAGRETTVR